MVQQCAFVQPVTVEVLNNCGGITPLKSELIYYPADPWTVAMNFNPDGNSVRWEFSRDLLIDGLVQPTGDGDVHVWPCLDSYGRAVVVVELCSPGGEALVQLPSDVVIRFTERMKQAVEVGTETVDVDAAIAAILAAESA